MEVFFFRSPETFARATNRIEQSLVAFRFHFIVCSFAGFCIVSSFESYIRAKWCVYPFGVGLIMNLIRIEYARVLAFYTHSIYFLITCICYFDKMLHPPLCMEKISMVVIFVQMGAFTRKKHINENAN